MSGASHVTVAGEAGAAENLGQAAEPAGTTEKPNNPAPEKPAEAAKPSVENKEPEKSEEGTFLGLNAHDWTVGAIGAGLGGLLVGGICWLCGD